MAASASGWPHLFWDASRGAGRPAQPALVGVLDHLRRHVLENEGMAHLAWYSPKVEAYREAELAHARGLCYLDYAGAALFGRAQLAAATSVLLTGILANPHTSPATAELIAEARAKVLEMFNVSADTHTVVFTSGATQALQLVGENFAWSRDSIFLYSDDCHTSAVGLRQFAKRAHASCGFFELGELPHLAVGLARAQPLEESRTAAAPWPPQPAAADAANLLVFPGESNFSGARADLACMARLRAGPQRWRVLLDAAKLACTPGALDLSACPADFAAVSFYKIFGYPTGLGALIVRHDAAPLLSPVRAMSGASGPEGAFGPSYFGGGCVSSISSSSGFAVPRPALSQWLERGTSHFQGICTLPSQIRCLEDMASAPVRRRHTLAVCHEAYLRMRGLRHRSGRPLCTIFGRHDEAKWWSAQGPTIAAVMHFADGSCIPYGLVSEKAKERSIVLRTGCHCNPGACMKHLDLSDKDIRYFFASGKVCGDDMGVIDGRHTGVVRISFGTFSTLDDVSRWTALLEDEFLNRLPTEEACRQCEGGHAATGEEPSGYATEGPPRPLPAAGRVVAVKVYPIKGCGPLRVRRWPFDPDTGALFLDRRWCLAVGSGDASSSQRLRPISAKQAPLLTQVRLSLRPRRGASGGLALVLWAKDAATDVEVPLTAADGELLLRSGAEVDGAAPSPGAATSDSLASAAGSEHAAQEVARWFERLLSLPSLRFVEANTGAAAGTGESPVLARSPQHFANAPNTLLLVSTASLQDFGRLCGLPVPSERFRANLEVDFSTPYVEASWPIGSEVRVGSTALEAAGRCVRCQAVDIDPEDPTAKGTSLLAALATAQAKVGADGNKGPTFGTLLRPRGSRSPAGSEANVVAVGMLVEHEPCASAASATEVKVFV